MEQEEGTVIYKLQILLGYHIIELNRIVSFVEKFLIVPG